MRLKILAFVFAVVTGATSLSAQTLAFTANGSGERQNYSYTLGLFFDLSQSLTVASVGYWDDNLDGVSSTLSVAIFDSGTQAVVAGTRLDFSGMDGVLFGTVVADQKGPGGVTTSRSGQFRMANLASPITLLASHQYALLAWGFNFYNQILNNTASAAVDMYPFGGMTFVGSGYIDNAGVLPTPLNNTFPQYTVATFSNTAIPEPAHVALGAGVIALLGCLLARRFAAT